MFGSAALLALAGCAQLPTAGSEARPRTIRTVGKATKHVEPDRARLVITVESHAPSADEAVRANAHQSGVVIRRLRTLVGEEGTVSTRSYRLNPEHAWEEGGGRRRRVVTGYVAANTVEAETANLGGLGAIIDAATGAGASRADSVSFFLAKPEAAQRRAVKEAGRRAHAEAEVLAEALGVRLGRLLEASTTALAPPSPRLPMARSVAKEASTTPIIAGKLEVHATATVVYAID